MLNTSADVLKAINCLSFRNKTICGDKQDAKEVTADCVLFLIKLR